MPRCARDACRRWRPDVLGHSGVLVDGGWYCSSDCVEQLAVRRLAEARPAVGRSADGMKVRLGSYLRQEGIVTLADVERALDAQRATGLRLGAQLVALDLASPAAIVRALARQESVPYLLQVDEAAVAKAPGRLSRQAARALSLVPISEPIAGTIKVACQAPVPRLGLAVFQRLTGLTPLPYLVGDAAWELLHAAYGSAAGDRETALFVETDNAAKAASSITAAIAGSRRVRLTEARFDPYVWIRVQSDADTQDADTQDIVLVPGRGLQPCLAASTLH